MSRRWILPAILNAVSVAAGMMRGDPAQVAISSCALGVCLTRLVNP